MKTLTLTEAETTELIILVRREMEELDKLVPTPIYEKFHQRRIEIMNTLHDKLMRDDFTIIEVEE